MKRIDENYFKVDESIKENKIEDVLEENENILWREKPNSKAYMWAKVLVMLPIALIWIIFDAFFIGMMISSGAFESEFAPPIVFVCIFFLLHLTPVWIWIGGIVGGSMEIKNIEYAFTDKRIIVRSGAIGIDFKNIYYTDVQSVNLRVGITDKIFKVGDVYIKANNESVVLFDIKNPYHITSKLQKITLDIKSDIYYPNALRPDENPGYKTKYKGE